MTKLVLDILTTLIVGIAFIAGLFWVKKSSPAFYKLFIFFLLITFLNETLCFYLKKTGYKTIVFYNLYYYFRFPFLIWIYCLMFKIQRYFCIYILITIALFVYCIIDFGIDQKIHTPFFIFGCASIIVAAITFFIIHLRKVEFEKPFEIPFFWITTGLFIFFLFISPFFGIINYLNKNALSFAKTGYYFIKIINFFLYSLFVIDFYFEWKRGKSYS